MSSYLVLEYADGGELFSLITKHGRMTEDKALPIFRQILSALYFCQMVNVSHRDLKPENILLTAAGQVKLVDFGLGKITPKGSLLSSTCGSPHYLAPEIVSFETYDARKTDVWSLGCVFYTLLAGHLPFEGRTQELLLNEVRRGSFRVHTFFSPEATHLLMRMICVDPLVRIKLSQIWRHPLVARYAPQDRLPGRPRDIYSAPLTLWDVEAPLVQSRQEIDRETMQNLKVLHPGKSEEQIVSQLKSLRFGPPPPIFFLSFFLSPPPTTDRWNIAQTASSWYIASSSSTGIATPSVIPTSSSARDAAETWPQPSSTTLRRRGTVAPGDGRQPSRRCRPSITTPKALLTSQSRGRIACQEGGSDGIPTGPMQTTILLRPPRVRSEEWGKSQSILPERLVVD